MSLMLLMLLQRRDELVPRYDVQSVLKRGSRGGLRAVFAVVAFHVPDELAAMPFAFATRLVDVAIALQQNG